MLRGERDKVGRDDMVTLAKDKLDEFRVNHRLFSFEMRVFRSKKSSSLMEGY